MRYTNEIDTLPKGYEEKVEQRVFEMREMFGISNPDGQVSFKTLQAIQTYIFENFTYVSDDYQFEENDLWDTQAFDKLMFWGKFSGDCDDFGYCILECLYRVCEVPKTNIYRASCLTETDVGHFVAWTKATDGVIYQLENRKPTVHTLRYYKELGYRYIYYSPMTRVDAWWKAEKFVAKAIYNTPNNVVSDKPVFSVKKVLKAHKSKTLLKGWLQAGALTTTALSALLSSSAELVALFSNANIKSIIVASCIIMLILTAVDLYLRTVTNRDIDMKDGLDD